MASIAGNVENGSVAPCVHTAAVLRDADDSPRTASGKRPTVASFQRKSEYMAWLASPKCAAMPDDERDDSYEAFQERLQMRVVKQREDRSVQGKQKRKSWPNDGWRRWMALAQQLRMGVVRARERTPEHESPGGRIAPIEASADEASLRRSEMASAVPGAVAFGSWARHSYRP